MILFIDGQQKEIYKYIYNIYIYIYMYIYKSTVGKGKQQGETEFQYKNCSPKIKDKTIKNRISNM